MQAPRVLQVVEHRWQQLPRALVEHEYEIHHGHGEQPDKERLRRAVLATPERDPNPSAQRANIHGKVIRMS